MVQLSVQPELGPQGLLDPDVVHVLPRRRDQDETFPERARLLDLRRRERARLRRGREQDVFVLGRDEDPVVRGSKYRLRSRQVVSETHSGLELRLGQWEVRVVVAEADLRRQVRKPKRVLDETGEVPDRP